MFTTILDLLDFFNLVDFFPNLFKVLLINLDLKSYYRKKI